MIENDIARHLKEAITEKEHSGTEAENGRIELQSGIHLQSGETDVDPVEPGHNVKEKKKRDKAKGDLPQCACGALCWFRRRKHALVYTKSAGTIDIGC